MIYLIDSKMLYSMIRIIVIESTTGKRGMHGVNSPEVWRGHQQGNHDLWVLCQDSNQLSSIGSVA